MEQYEELASQIYALRITLTTLITTLDKHETPFSANLLYSHMNVLQEHLELAANSSGNAKLLEEFESLLDEVGAIADS